MNLELPRIIIGWISTVLLTLFNVPQLIKTIKIKNTKGLNKYSYLIILFGASIFGLSMGLTNADGKPIIQTYFAEIIFDMMILPLLFFILKREDKLIVFWIFLVLIILIFIVGGLSMILGWYKSDIANNVAIALNIIGIIGITTAFLPQTINFIKNKEVNNYSLIAGYIYVLAISTLFIFLILNGIQSVGVNRISAYFSAGMQVIGWTLQIIMIFITIKYRQRYKSS